MTFSCLSFFVVFSVIIVAISIVCRFHFGVQHQIDIVAPSVVAAVVVAAVVEAAVVEAAVVVADPESAVVPAFAVVVPAEPCLN